MFGFLDKETPEVARRLFERVKEIDLRYLRVPFAEAAELARNDFAETDRFISDREISLRCSDLDFGFTITEIGEPVVSAHGNGSYTGFMLQSSAEDRSWFTSVYKSAARPQGAKAQALANHFEKQLGVTNFSKVMARHRR